MIEDVKWLKPDDYAARFRNRFCWIAKDGIVIKGYFNLSEVENGFNYFGSEMEVISVIPDGVCARGIGQQKPVLR